MVISKTVYICFTSPILDTHPCSRYCVWAQSLGSKGSYRSLQCSCTSRFHTAVSHTHQCLIKNEWIRGKEKVRERLTHAFKSLSHYLIIDLGHECLAKAGLKSISLIQSHKVMKSNSFSFFLWRRRHTLTHAHGKVSCGFKAVVTQTAVAALCVDTFTMAAHIGNFQTFITVCNKETFH